MFSSAIAIGELSSHAKGSLLKIPAFLFCVAVLVIPHTQALNTTMPYRDCGSPYGYLTRLELIPQCQRNICVLKRGEDATLISDFVPKVNVKESKIDVYYTDWRLGVDTLLWNKKPVCGRWNVTCPYEAYDTVYSVFTMTLPKELPSLKLWLKVIVYGDNDLQLLCHSAPLDIQ